MQTSAWNDGGSTYGIRVGTRNRSEFFDTGWAEVEIEMDGEVHRLPLSGGFWRNCPEIRSPALREWLRRHHTLEWPKNKPPRMELIPLGGNRFQLVP
jgi:hypothetical protein